MGSPLKNYEYKQHKLQTLREVSPFKLSDYWKGRGTSIRKAMLVNNLEIAGVMLVCIVIPVVLFPFFDININHYKSFYSDPIQQLFNDVGFSGPSVVAVIARLIFIAY